MKLRKELMLLSIISIVFLAGCTQGSEAPAANGIVITSFVPDVTTTDGSLPVTFVLGLKNVGEKAATSVRTQIFGLSDKWAFDTTTPRDKFKEVTSSLAPADPTANLPGEEASFTWSATSAAGTTSDVTYDANVRVAYTYSTNTTALFRVVDASYLRTNPNVVRGLVSSDATGGPLLVTSTVRSPIVSGANRVARIQFEIQNVGGGKVLSDTPAVDVTSIDATKLDTLKKITVEASNIKSCAGVTTPGSGKIELSTNLRLVGGKSKVISCDIDVTSSTFQDIQVNIAIDYSYFVDSATQVTILRALQ